MTFFERVKPTYLGIFGVTLASLPVAAQDTPSGPSVLKMTSRLVVLDVTVVDKNQATVRDLTQGDFTIYESGKQQTIGSFESFSDHALPPSVTTESLHGTAGLQGLAPRAPVTVLVLDELNTNFEDSAFARTSIRKYLDGAARGT